MSLPIGILGSTGGGVGAQFVVPQVVAYSGVFDHTLTAQGAGELLLAASFINYAGPTDHVLSLGEIISAGFLNYSGPTDHALNVGSSSQVAPNLTNYSGPTEHAIALLGTQSVNPSAVPYSGVTDNAIAITGEIDLNAGSTAYTGPTDHEIDLAGATGDVEILDTWSSFTGVGDGTFTVSAGTDRLLVLAIAVEGGTITVGTPTYGNQAMTLAVSEPAGGNLSQIWTLNEAGIAAAVDDEWDADLSGTSGAEVIAIAAYEGVNQASPVLGTGGSSNASGAAADVDILTSDGGLLVAQAISGNSSVFAWDAPLGEQTDARDGSSGASVAHLVPTDGTTVTVGVTISGLSPNRSSIAVAAIKPASAVATPDITTLSALADTGASSGGDGGTKALVAGSNRMMVYVQHLRSTAAANADTAAVSYGGQAMTARVTSAAIGSGGNRVRTRIYTLDEAGLAAAVGTTFTDDIGSATLRAAAVLYGNVDQTTPVVDSDSATAGSGGDIDIPTMTTEDGGVVIAATTGNAFATTPSAVWSGVTEAVDDVSVNMWYSSGDGATDGTDVDAQTTITGATSNNSGAGLTLRKA